MPVNGLVVMTPTSISSTGTGNSSSINSNGSVTHTSCTSLELRGVFTTDYDNYMVTYRGTTNLNQSIRFQLLAATTPATTNYTRQYLQASSTTVNGSRAASQSEAIIAESFAAQRYGYTLYLFGPKIAQPTAGRAVGALDELSASIIDSAFTHSTATAYDGMKLSSGTSTMTGLITVYGFNQ